MKRDFMPGDIVYYNGNRKNGVVLSEKEQNEYAVLFLDGGVLKIGHRDISSTGRVFGGIPKLLQLLKGE